MLEALLELLPAAVAELQLVFQSQGEADYVEVALRALRALGTRRRADRSRARVRLSPAAHPGRRVPGHLVQSARSARAADRRAGPTATAARCSASAIRCSRSIASARPKSACSSSCSSTGCATCGCSRCGWKRISARLPPSSNGSTSRSRPCWLRAAMRSRAQFSTARARRRLRTAAAACRFIRSSMPMKTSRPRASSRSFATRCERSADGRIAILVTARTHVGCDRTRAHDSRHRLSGDRDRTAARSAGRAGPHRVDACPGASLRIGQRGSRCCVHRGAA